MAVFLFFFQLKNKSPTPQHSCSILKDRACSVLTEQRACHLQWLSVISFMTPCQVDNCQLPGNVHSPVVPDPIRPGSVVWTVNVIDFTHVHIETLWPRGHASLRAVGCQCLWEWMAVRYVITLRDCAVKWLSNGKREGNTNSS